jgi:signal transduction histidine kinase
MCAASDSFCVYWTELLQATSFRLAATLALLFGSASILIFLFIYWQTAGSETRRIEALITADAAIEAGEPAAAIRRFLDDRAVNDFHHLTYAGLFDSMGRKLDGNLDEMPPSLAPDGAVHVTAITRADDDGRHVEIVRAVERRLDDGSYLVLGRNTEELERLRRQVALALAWGLAPTIGVPLATGVALGRRARKRVKAVTDALERIRQGKLRERLPIHGGGEDFDRLAETVNRMLTEIERLLDEVRRTGDEIARDLRTPLAQVKQDLATARGCGVPLLLDAIDHALDSLDQALATITALLRIREIEAGRRRAGFKPVELSAIVALIDELYQPVAEDQQVDLVVAVAGPAWIQGDAELLTEMLGQLVDTTLKSTAPGGRVSITLQSNGAGLRLGIASSGPGGTEPGAAKPARGLVTAIANLHEIEEVESAGDSGGGIDLLLPLPAEALAGPDRSKPDLSR